MKQKAFEMLKLDTDEEVDALTDEQRLAEIGSLIINMRTALTEYHRNDQGMYMEHVINRGDWDQYLMRIEDHLTFLHPGLIG